MLASRVSLLLSLALVACVPVTQIAGSSGSTPTPAGAAGEPTGGAGEPRPAQIDSVQIEKGLGSPIPVHAVIALVLPSPCDQVAQVSQARQGTTIQLTVLTTTSADPGCTSDLIPFVLKVPINTVGLPIGEYSVDVNGTRATFEQEVGPVDVLSEPEATPVIREAQIDDVSLVMGLGSPIPVHVVVHGNLPDTCAQLGEVQLRRVGEAGTGFQLSVMTHSLAGGAGTEAVCVPDSLPFRLEFPLNILGLMEGEINVTVNGVSASLDPQAGPPSGRREIEVADVQVQVGVGSPIPVEVLVSGTWPDLCAQLAEVHQHIEGDQVQITLLATPADPNCPPDQLGLPFRIALPLNGVQLPNGTYTIMVNGASTTFTWPLEPGS